jgi:hypothetical protein
VTQWAGGLVGAVVTPTEDRVHEEWQAGDGLIRAFDAATCEGGEVLLVEIRLHAASGAVRWPCEGRGAAPAAMFHPAERREICME